MATFNSNSQGQSQPADLTTATGTVSILQADDFENQRCERLYFLREASDGADIQLRFEGKVPRHLRSGASVRIKGRRTATEMVLPDSADSVQTLQPAAPSDLVAGIIAGEQKTAVLLINFSDAALECSAAAMSGMMFTNSLSIDGLYREVSYTNVFFSGSVFGPYTINYSKTGSCNYSAWASAAEAAAAADGVNLSQFTRKVYVFPRGTSCGWAGLGTIGGNPSQSWIADCNLVDVFAHELGHNLTLHHSSTDANNDSVSDCEYCDTSDFMGYGGVGFRQINAPHKEQMGWTPNSKIITATSSGSFNLAPLEMLPASAPAPQILKIARAGTADYYYVSYRRAIGYDTGLQSQYVDRIQIHHYQPGSGSQSYFIKALIDGEQFSDPTTGITLTQISHNNSYATVQVAFSGCTPATPTTALAPATQIAIAGATKTYTFTLTNNDSALCPATTFTLGRTLPAGWSGSVAPASLTLSPGQSGTATLTVTSSAVATTGDYPLTLTVADGVNNTHTTTTSATYTVQPSNVCTPAAPTLVMTPPNQTGPAGSALTYAINLTNNDSAQCSAATFAFILGAHSGWTTAFSPAVLTLSPGQTGNVTLTVTSSANVPVGSYPLNVMVSDSGSPIHTTSIGGSYDAISNDFTPPTAPTNIVVRLRPGKVLLKWTGANDNVRVTKYFVWRDGVNLGETKKRRWNDLTITPGLTYTYSIVAADAAGNLSAASNPTTVAISLPAIAAR